MNAGACPRCGHENQCENSLFDRGENLSARGTQNSVNKNEEASCWCMSIELDENQRQEIKKYTESRRCLCATCIASLIK